MLKFFKILLIGIFVSTIVQAQDTLTPFQEAEGVGGDVMMHDSFLLETQSWGEVSILSNGSSPDLNYTIPRIDDGCGLDSLQYLEVTDSHSTRLQLLYEINCFTTGYSAYAEASFSDDGSATEVAFDVGGFNIGPAAQHGDLVLITSIGSISLYNRDARQMIFERSDLYDRYGANAFEAPSFDFNALTGSGTYRFPLKDYASEDELCLAWPSGALELCQ